MDDNDRIIRHAEHFLGRLDRLNTREVDLALNLYRDPGLLRGVLQFVSLPDAADRVAISLDDPALGPFLVVTRTGYFVTCLAKGMHPGSLPVVNRGQLDALSLKVNTLRERMAEAARLTRGSDRACGQLLRRVLLAGDNLSREEFLAVSAWEPLLAPVFMDLYVGLACELPILAPQMARLKSTKGTAGEALHAYWQQVFAAGSMALLATMSGGVDHLDALVADQPGARSSLAFGLTSTGSLRFIAQGAWAIGRLNKHVLPAYKQSLGEAICFLDLVDTVFGVLAISRRAARLRSEIVKALHAAPGTSRSQEAVVLRREMGPEVSALCTLAAEFVEAEEAPLDAGLVRLGSHLLVSSDGAGPPPDLPEDIARSVALQSLDDGITDLRRIACAMSIIVAAVRLAPEQFYLPRDVLSCLRVPWKPSDSQMLLRPHQRLNKLRFAPVTRKKPPGPNEPCSCGSGTKYKKCCGRIA